MPLLPDFEDDFWEFLSQFSDTPAEEFAGILNELHSFFEEQDFDSLRERIEETQTDLDPGFIPDLDQDSQAPLHFAGYGACSVGDCTCPGYQGSQYTDNTCTVCGHHYYQHW